MGPTQCAFDLVVLSYLDNKSTNTDNNLWFHSTTLVDKLSHEGPGLSIHHWMSLVWGFVDIQGSYLSTPSDGYYHWLIANKIVISCF